MYCYFTLFFKNLLKKIIIKWAGLAWGMLLAKCITLMPIVDRLVSTQGAGLYNSLAMYTKGEFCSNGFVNANIPNVSGFPLIHPLSLFCRLNTPSWRVVKMSWLAF